MSDSGLAVLDGSHLLDADLRLPLPGGPATGAQLVQLCEVEASARLLGLSLPDTVKSAVLRRIDDGGFLGREFGDAESQEAKIREYFLALADVLKDEPLVISFLDGSALQVCLEDEDDFAMLSENLFTELDVDDRGKLSKNEIRNALVHMGVGMGVPPFSESRNLLENIVKKHGAEGEEQLGQAQFAQLLQTILQDITDALAAKPVTVVQNIKVVNGSKLNKILGEEDVLDSVTEKMFQEWNATRAGGDNKKALRAILESKGTEIGFPSSESSELVILYDQIFAKVGEEKFSGDPSRREFGDVVKSILKMFADQLEANPVFIDSESQGK